MDMKRKLLVVAIVFGLALAAAPSANAGTRFEDSSTGRQVILGTGSGLASLLYSPAKFCYAAGATITGGLVLAFTAGASQDTAGTIVRQGVLGDWWVHPDVFTGHRALHFVGR